MILFYYKIFMFFLTPFIFISILLNPIDRITIDKDKNNKLNLICLIISLFIIFQLICLISII